MHKAGVRRAGASEGFLDGAGKVVRAELDDVGGIPTGTAVGRETQARHGDVVERGAAVGSVEAEIDAPAVGLGLQRPVARRVAGVHRRTPRVEMAVEREGVRQRVGAEAREDRRRDVSVLREGRHGGIEECLEVRLRREELRVAVEDAVPDVQAVLPAAPPPALDTLFAYLAAAQAAPADRRSAVHVWLPLLDPVDVPGHRWLAP